MEPHSPVTLFSYRWAPPINATSSSIKAHTSTPTALNNSSPLVTSIPHSVPYHTDPTLSERQKRRRFEKALLQNGFEGTVILTSNPAKSNECADIEDHHGEKNNRMVFWAKGCTIDGVSGLGIVGQAIPDSGRTIWRA